MELSTTYMGLELDNPLVASASPLSHTVDGVRRLADAGIGAVVLHSLFEEQLREEVIKLAKKLMQKSPATLRYTKEAIRAVRFMNEPQAQDYLAAKSDALRFNDKENSREEGMKQFLDEKSYRPGYGHFKRKRASA